MNILLAAILCCFSLCVVYSQDSLPSKSLASGTQEFPLTLVYPNGGEELLPGSNIFIRWRGIPAGDTVTLQYSTNKGQTWTTITQKATGWKHPWRIPSNPGLQYMVRVQKPRKSNVVDEDLVAVYGLLDVRKVRWNPAGRLLAMAEGVNVRVWDREDRKYVATKSTSTIQFHSVAWNREGTLLAAGTETGQIFIWDVASWQIVKVLTVDQGTIHELFWKTGGQELLVCSAKKIQFWNTLDWTVLRELSTEGNVFSWNEAGKQLAVARNYNFTIWNTDTFEKVSNIAVLDGIRDVTFSPDGSKIALTQSYRGRVFSTSNWQEIAVLQNPTDPDKFIYSIAWSPDGRWIASGSTKAVIVHSTADWKPVTTLSLIADARYLTTVKMGISLDWSSSGFLAAGGDSQVHLWDGKSSRFLYKLDDARPNNFQVFSPDGKYFSFADIYQHGIRICETNTWNVAATLLGHTDYVNCQAWSNDSRYLASGGNDSTVRIWNIATKQMEHFLSGFSGFIYSISWNIDGKKLAVAHGKKVRIYQMDPDGKDTWQFVTELSDFTYDIRFVSFSPDSKHLFINYSGIWNTETWEKEKSLSIGAPTNQSVAWSPSGSYLATTGRWRVIIWNTTTWEAVKTIPGEDPITWSADSRRLAIGAGSPAQVYNTDSWEVETTLSKMIRNGNATFHTYTASLNPDGTFLATLASSDLYGKIWRLSPDILEEDRSDAPWSIRPVSPLVVTSPKGGEHFLPENTIPIRWEGVAATDTVILSFSMDNGRTWKEIAKTTGLQYTWKAPNINSKACLIRAQARELVPDTVTTYRDIYAPSFSSTASGISSIVFNARGTSVLTVHRGDGSVRLWRTDLYVEKASLVKYDFPLVAAGFLDNDRRILTVNQRGRVTIWDADSGEELDTLIERTLSGVNPVVYSVAMNSAGTRLAIMGSNGAAEPSFRELKIFDITTGEEVQSISATANSYGMVFAPDGKTLIIGGNKLQVRDASTLQILRQIDIEQAGGTEALAISADGTKIAISRGGIVYEFASLKELVKLGYNESTSYARFISFSADGRYLVTSHVNFYTDYIVWDVNTGQRAHHLVDSDQNASVLMFNPAKLQVISGGNTTTMRVWNELDEYWQEATSAALWSIGKEHPDPLRLVSPNGSEVFVPGETVTLQWSGVSARDTVALSYSTDRGKTWYSIAKQVTGLSYQWRAPSELTSSYLARVVYGAQPDTVFTIRYRRDAPYRLAWSHDGTKIAVIVATVIRIYNATNGQVLQTFTGHTGSINDLQWSHNDNYIVSSSNDSTARVWDVLAGNASLILPMNSSIYHSFWSPDDTKIAVQQEGDSSPAFVCDVASGKILYTLSGHLSRVTGVSWSPDGKTLATASFDGTVRLWNMADGRLSRILMGHSGYVYAAVWSHDGTKIATTSQDRTARIWNVEDGKTLTVIPKLKSLVFEALWSPDDSRLLLPALDSGSGIWSVGGGLPLVSLSDFSGINGHNLWHPYGKKILAPVPGRAIAIRDAETGAVLSTLGNYTGAVYSAAWSPDGRYIATTTADSIVRIWSIPATMSGQDVSDSFWTVQTVNVSVPEENVSGREPALHIVPNPAYDEAEVTLYLAQREFVRATVEDALGRTVQVIFEGEQSPGVFRHRLLLDNLAQGQYFVRLQTATTTETAILHIYR